MSASPTSRFVRIQELAGLVGLSVQTLRRLSQHPDCPVIRPPGLRVVLFDVEEFKAWLRAGENKGRSCTCLH